MRNRAQEDFASIAPSFISIAPLTNSPCYISNLLKVGIVVIFRTAPDLFGKAIVDLSQARSQVGSVTVNWHTYSSFLPLSCSRPPLSFSNPNPRGKDARADGKDPIELSFAPAKPGLPYTAVTAPFAPDVPVFFMGRIARGASFELFVVPASRSIFIRALDPGLDSTPLRAMIDASSSPLLPLKPPQSPSDTTAAAALAALADDPHSTLPLPSAVHFTAAHLAAFRALWGTSPVLRSPAALSYVICSIFSEAAFAGGGDGSCSHAPGDVSSSGPDVDSRRCAAFATASALPIFIALSQPSAHPEYYPPPKDSSGPSESSCKNVGGGGVSFRAFVCFLQAAVYGPPAVIADLIVTIVSFAAAAVRHGLAGQHKAAVAATKSRMSSSGGASASDVDNDVMPDGRSWGTAVACVAPDCSAGAEVSDVGVYALRLFVEQVYSVTGGGETFEEGDEFERYDVCVYSSLGLIAAMMPGVSQPHFFPSCAPELLPRPPLPVFFLHVMEYGEVLDGSAPAFRAFVKGIAPDLWRGALLPVISTYGWKRSARSLPY